jgi:hypothetical protein
VTNNAAKPDCICPTGDNGSLYEGCSSGKLIIIKIKETLLSRKQQLCQKCKHQQSHFNSPNTDSKKKLLEFLIKEKRLASHVVFLVKPKYYVPSENQFFVCLSFF